MQRADFSEMTCSIARSLGVAGEPWSPLVLRNARVGINRFDDLRRDLGVSRKVLAERLKHLVEEGRSFRGPARRRRPRAALRAVRSPLGHDHQHVRGVA